MLEAQIRQIFASVVWTHKIQEKQADIYKSRQNYIEIIRILASAITTSGIIATVFIDGRGVKIATAIISIISLFIGSYAKAYDLSKLHYQHKTSALQFLELRERIISLLCDMKTGRIKEEDMCIQRDKLLKDLMTAYKNTPDVSYKAVSKASHSLKDKGDNTYSNDEIDSFLPIMLRKAKKGD